MGTDRDVNLYVYSNATQGWVKYGKVEGPTFIQGTGGTTATSGDYKPTHLILQTTLLFLVYHLLHQIMMYHI